VALQANHLLYRDFPIGISRPYKELALAPDWGTRHLGLLGLADAAIAYLASLCLSDYRTRAREPARSVEVMLEQSRSKKLTLGRELALFRASASAIEGPLIPAPAESPKRGLEALGRFVAAVDAVQAAVDGLHSEASPAAIDIDVHVARGLSGGFEPKLGWWEGWERLVAYRNKVSHFDSERWPIYSPGYWDIMGPLLHDGMAELLTQQEVSEAVLAHPVFQITRIRSDGSGNFVHSLCGEERGVYFERDVIAPQPVTERWSSEHWKATDASSCILERDGAEWRMRSLFWDLHNGVPPVMDMEAADSAAKPVDGGGRRPVGGSRKAREGRGTAPGTCGELAQGILSSGVSFHVTCPINKSATVVASLRPANALKILGLGEDHLKLELAIQHAVELLDLGAVEVTARHWSDLDVGKGMGSSTADVLAGMRAIADAAGETMSPKIEGRVAAMVESSDGSMYPGIAAVNHKTCELVKAWDWYPELVIVMLVPNNSVDTASIPFLGQERLAEDYEDLLGRMDSAVRRRSIAEFAEQSTRSAVMNDEFLLNPYSRNLSSRLDEFNALGLSVGHTGTVCGLLFANTEAGRTTASEAFLEVGRQFPDLKDIKVVTTPHCEIDKGGAALGPGG
jgi:L-threonine kinase